MTLSIKLPGSALVVLSSLTTKGPMTPKSIKTNVRLPSRTITFALHTLVEERIVRKIPNLADMRQPLYHVDLDRVKELQLMFQIDQVSRLQAEIRNSGVLTYSFTR